ncbi:Fc receptor-like protein 2 isoform X2 [Brachyhypopomus gauderio]|uniref:Fc receptor-like protein 2 isoform X2 n=1 Tax=Brachyhypopomus gauderio TaxID=698409 RepID=UPI00404303B2
MKPGSLSVMLLLISLAQTGLAQGKPQTVVTINPGQHVSKGEKVTLRCEIVGEQNPQWTYKWYKNTLPVIVHVGQEYRLGYVTWSHTGAYLCEGHHNGTNQTSHLSSAVILTVSGVHSASLNVTPSRTQHFSGHSLSLSCEVKGDSTGWRVRRYTYSGAASNCSSGWGSVTGSACNISSLYTNHTGVYWCQSESAGSSIGVNITVHNGSVILDSPVHPLTEGDRLILRCLVKNTTNHRATHVIAAFYKDGSLIKKQTTVEMPIHSVTKSDEGFYYCNHSEKVDSPKSWISVRAGHNPLGLVAVGLGSSLLLLILVILLYYYKAQTGHGCLSPSTGHQQNSNQTSDQNQQEVDCKSSQPGLPPQAGGPAAEPSDVTYSQGIIFKNEKPANKNAGSEPTDVTYADITLISTNNEKRKQEKTSVAADSVYSELK